MLSGNCKGGEFLGLTLYSLDPAKAILRSVSQHLFSVCVSDGVDIGDTAVNEIETIFTLKESIF